MSSKIRYEPLIADAKFEKSVRGPQQMPRIRQPLLIVCIEQRRLRSVLDDQSQFPREVITVLNAGVHPLRAGRRVNVGCVASDKSTAFGKFVHRS